MLVKAEIERYKRAAEECFLEVLTEFKRIVLIGNQREDDDEDEEVFFDAESVSDCEEESEEEVTDWKCEIIRLGLAQEVNRALLRLIEEHRREASNFLDNLMAIEAAHVHTNDPQFWRQCQEYLRESFKTNNNTDLEESANDDNIPFKEIQVNRSGILGEFLALFQPSIKRVEYRPFQRRISIAKLEEKPEISEELKFTLAVLETYLSGVKRSLADSVPKAISHFLIQKTLSELPNLLIPKAFCTTNNSISNLDTKIREITSKIDEIDAKLLGLLP